MKQYCEIIEISTRGIKLYDISERITNWIKYKNANSGLLNISILHTSASILLQENADPDVLEDLKNFYNKIAPFDFNYIHSSEGQDDMPAHIKTSLTNTNITLSIIDKKIILGNWQGIFLFEHRTADKKRKINLHYIGI